MINLSAMPLSHPWVQSKGSFRSFRKRYANQGRIYLPAQDRPAVAGLADSGLANRKLWVPPIARPLLGWTFQFR